MDAVSPHQSIVEANIQEIWRGAEQETLLSYDNDLERIALDADNPILQSTYAVLWASFYRMMSHD